MVKMLLELYHGKTVASDYLDHVYALRATNFGSRKDLAEHQEWNAKGYTFAGGDYRYHPTGIDRQRPREPQRQRLYRHLRLR